jgi:hypothetical protein
MVVFDVLDIGNCHSSVLSCILSSIVNVRRGVIAADGALPYSAQFRELTLSSARKSKFLIAELPRF